MYIVLDTNIFTADKQFRHSFWRLIGARPKRWGLYVAVPWPVVQEAVANGRRDLEVMLADLNAVLKRVARHGVAASSAEETIQAIQSEIDGYEAWFERKLKSLRIDVLSADFDHSETVRRAVNRLPPCNAKGDGYRDTLNWLTVLRLVERKDDQDVIWVSNDSDFFAGTDPLLLHRNLIEDLVAIGGADRFSCRRDLAEAQQLLIDKHQLDAESWGWSTLQERVAEVVVAELNVTEHILDPISCGLPMDQIAHALLESATESGPAAVTNLEADTPGQDRVLPFEVHFDAQCRLVQYSRMDGEASIGLADDSAQEIVPKQLLASGTIHVNGQTHEVTDVVVDGVTGAADDPDVLRNQAQVQRAAWVQGIVANSQQSERDGAASLAKLVTAQPAIAKMIAEQQESFAKSVGAQSAVGKMIAEVVRTQESLTNLVGAQSAVGKMIAEQQDSIAKSLGAQSTVGKVMAEVMRTQDLATSMRSLASQQAIPRSGATEGATGTASLDDGEPSDTEPSGNDDI